MGLKSPMAFRARSPSTVFRGGGETTVNELSFGVPSFDTVAVDDLRPEPERAPSAK